MSVYQNDNIVYLKEALQSLYDQTVPVDIFIQEDGPVSDEIDACLEEALEEKKICFLGKRTDNIGLAGSLNELIAKVRENSYAYVARMDADDISMPDRMEKQWVFLKRHSDIDIVGGAIEEFSTQIDYAKIVKYPLDHNAMYVFFAKRVPLAHVSVMYRERFFEKAGYYPVSSPTNEDTLMWMQGFLSHCRFANIPEVVVKVRISKSFFERRGGVAKAWSDLKDRIKVIRTLRYNLFSYLYALLLFGVNIAPPKVKQFLYKRLR
jgi:glycosyltransferase involved in cell wall biosynthesis